MPSLHPRPAGRVETRPGGLRHRRDNSRRPRLRSALQKGKALPARLRHCRRRASPSQGGIRARFVAPAQAGSAFGLFVWFSACRRLAVIGRVSPRGRPSFVWRQRRWIKTPCRSAGSRQCPRSAGPAGRRNSPSRAQTSTRQFPPAAGCARRCRRGKRRLVASPLPAATSLECRCSGRGIRHERGLLDHRFVWLGACFRSAVNARSRPGDLFLVATRKMGPCRSAGCSPINLARRAAGGSRRNSPSRARTSTPIPPVRSCAGGRRGSAAGGFAIAFRPFAGTAFGTIRRPGAGRGPVPLVFSFEVPFGWR